MQVVPEQLCFSQGMSFYQDNRNAINKTGTMLLLNSVKGIYNTNTGLVLRNYTNEMITGYYFLLILYKLPLSVTL